jgi:hypothetical protein
MLRALFGQRSAVRIRVRAFLNAHPERGVERDT